MRPGDHSAKVPWKSAQDPPSSSILRPPGPHNLRPPLTLAAPQDGGLGCPGKGDAPQASAHLILQNPLDGHHHSPDPPGVPSHPCALPTCAKVPIDSLAGLTGFPGFTSPTEPHNCSSKELWAPGHHPFLPWVLGLVTTFSNFPSSVAEMEVMVGGMRTCPAPRTCSRIFTCPQITLAL